ncbi:MAG: GlxA family transcriptional regulator [Bradyrhizobium sp.]|nr:GlxA family transcriptional regulator [Bradyrhizobium sp.]
MNTNRPADGGTDQHPTIDSRTTSVAFLLVPGFAMLAYAAAIESLRAANQIAGRKLYDWRHLSPTAAAVAVASNGVELGCDCPLHDNRIFDKVFVCASDEAAKFDDMEAMAWLRSQATGGASMGGIGGGAFLLARAGLLKGRRVTLHWAYATAFREEYPGVVLRRSLYEIDGNIMTSGGGMSPLDMMHAIIRDEHGEQLAIGVSDWFLHTDIREGQAVQRLSFQARLGVHHPGLIRALEGMEGALEEPLARAQIAQIAGVSERQLDRLFRAQVGAGLSAYYLKLRLERARQLVLQSSLPLTEIAVACGFNSAGTFSKSYRAEFGEPPRNERVKQLQRHRAG